MDDTHVTARDGDRAERGEAITAAVGEWLARPALADLLTAFAGAAEPGAPEPEPAPPAPGDHLPDRYPAGPPDGSALLDRVLAVEAAASAAFDFRRGAGGAYVERWHAVRGDFGDELRELVLDRCTDLGLTASTLPSHDRYDATLILGGGFASPLSRARYAGHLAARGVDLGVPAFLGSPRPLITEPPEAEAAAGYAPGAADEFDLMAAAARTAFGVTGDRIEFLCGCDSAAAVCPRWRHAAAPAAAATPPAFTHERRVAFADAAGRPAGSALSAATGRPPYRPDTADTYDLWARADGVRPGRRVLVVTSQVFVPFQSFDALRRLHLPYGVEVDVVGYGSEWGGRASTTEYLLQETLSAIRSARRALFAAAEAGRDAG